MCGIGGFLTNNIKFDEKDYINELRNSLNHRGPDDSGYYHEPGCCLLNTRLSIIDIAHGHQPFVSDDGQIVVVQNGEIYNYVEIKSELQQVGITFNTSSDTEVILRAYEYEGIKCLKRFNGMFAIAILDKNKEKLYLCRDRLGVKPLYIYHKNDLILFASEIKSFLNHPEFDAKISVQSIHNYLKFNYIPVPGTIYEYVDHVMPGSYVEIDTSTLRTVAIEYWFLSNVERINAMPETEILDRLDSIILDAVKIRLRTDVGIGAFLSGGLDSSLMVSIVKHIFNISLDTYSIGFMESRFDESPYAREVAQALGINNSVKYLENDILNLWDTTTWFCDQPHGDISFIPTFLLARHASEAYKLVFTGDGGDEAFAGYTKYFSVFTNGMHDYFNSISLIKSDSDFDQLYTDSFRASVDYAEPYRIYADTVSNVDYDDDVNKILYFDTKHLLPGNNLVKPDKMAMANSLETRSPLLDYRLFEFMQSLPGNIKLRENTTKYILKKYSMKYLPEHIVYRKKQMFTVPVGEWFKTSLKDYISELLFSEQLSDLGIFSDGYLRLLLDEHVSGSRDRTRELRAIANLAIWMRRFKHVF